jgi:hypothetical protein
MLYRIIGNARQLCSEFRFLLPVKPGYAKEVGFISFDKAGRVTIKPGYCWDGASGPTIDTNDCVCAALGHDVMYELMRAGALPSYIYKPLADMWFRDRLLTDGMIQYRAFAWYRAVQLFGAEGTDPANAVVVRRAPKPFPSDPVRMIEPIPGYPIRALGA